MNANTTTGKCRERGRSGQAVTELVVALVALLVLFAGIVQISFLGFLHTRMMTEARRQAGVKAMQDASSFAGPDYIAARTVGADGIRYSRDDGTDDGDVSLFQAGMVRYAQPDRLNGQCPSNAFSQLYESTFPQLQFGLVEGEAVASTNLIPVVRTLLYRADTIDVVGKAWLIWTKGIY